MLSPEDVTLYSIQVCNPGGSKFEPHQPPRKPGAACGCFHDTLEAFLFEHSRSTDVGESIINAHAAGIDGVRLERGRSILSRALDRTLKQRPRYTAPPVGWSHEEADNGPHLAIIHGRNCPRADQSLQLMARPEATPPGDIPVNIGDHARRGLALKLLAQGISPLVYNFAKLTL